MIDEETSRRLKKEQVEEIVQLFKIYAPDFQI